MSGQRDRARKVMVSTAAYREEGTSYHYAPASDYIAVKNAGIVARFMKENGIPYVGGKTWTTDSFYRETVNNFKKRKEGESKGTQHDAGHFDIALELARYVI